MSNFIFCLHNHQPVGNFDHIFKWAYETCYVKILEILIEYPGFRFAVHHSGPLLEWISENKPGYFDLLKQMIDRDQAEIIGGGFYEPIFSVIRENDIKEQLSMMQNFCLKEFGKKPAGFWTAERVWDPEIPNLVSGQNLQFTFLDDIHFRYAGIEEKKLYGYYITERLDKKLCVFPIDKFLRYSIPFKLPAETIDYFKKINETNDNPLFIFGDDGEKLGLWPGTNKWVFEEKWLTNFIEAVLKEDWINMTHPSEFISNNPPVGRAYLTQGSYFELSEWALPAEAAVKLTNLNKEIKSMGRENDFYPFLKGGVWNNFLVKYPESNAINKRTILLSREIAEHIASTDEDCIEEKNELYKSECNCAYWHGLFGGIYLTHLRHALYEHMLAAEKLLLNRKGVSGASVLEADFWNHGRKQLLIRNRNQSVLILPYKGGAVSEFGLYYKKTNIFDVLQRRYEAYHETLINYNEDAVKNQNNEIASIHNRIAVKEKNLKKYLVYDNAERYSFKELVFNRYPGINELMFENPDKVEFTDVNCEYDISQSQSETIVSLSGSLNSRNQNIIISKKYFINDNKKGIIADYSLNGYTGLLGVELNINLLGSHDDHRYYNIHGISREESFLDIPGKSEKIKKIQLKDDARGIIINLISSISADFLWYPVYTVSQSDTGFEKNYQGSSILMLYQNFGENKNKFTIEISIE